MKRVEDREGGEGMKSRMDIAMEFAGVTGRELAGRLGVTPQQVSNWARGLRTPGRANAEEIARALGVSAAWLLGVGEKLPVMDPLTGDVFAGGILRWEGIDGYGALYHVWLEETGDVVPVILAGGVQFTPTDWTTLTVRSAGDIAGARWMDARGADAILLDGLPRVLV